MATRPKMNLEELLSVLMEIEAPVLVGDYDANTWASVVSVCGWTQDEVDRAVDSRWDIIEFLRRRRVTRGQA